MVFSSNTLGNSAVIYQLHNINIALTRSGIGKRLQNESGQICDQSP